MTGSPDQRVAPVPAAQAEPGEPPVESPEAFLADRGIAHMADVLVEGHDGEIMTLGAALAVCPKPVQNSIDATIQTIKDVGGPDIDVTEHLERSLTRMSERAQERQLTAAERAEAEKK